MPVVLGQVSVDAADPLAQARWWATVLGWVAGHDEDEPDEAWAEPADAPGPGVTRGPSDMGGLLFLRVPEGKTVKNRWHLDLRPANGSSQAAELDRLLTLGARPVDIGQGDVPWHVLADPEGNEFCLLRMTPDELAAAAALQDEPEPA